MLRNFIAFISVFFAICSPAFGQCALTTGAPIKVVRYPLGGGPVEILSCYNSDDTIVVTVADQPSWSGNWVIHVYDTLYDSSGAATHSSAAVTIQGASSDTAVARGVRRTRPAR